MAPGGRPFSLSSQVSESPSIRASPFWVPTHSAPAASSSSRQRTPTSCSGNEGRKRSPSSRKRPRAVPTQSLPARSSSIARTGPERPASSPNETSWSPRIRSSPPNLPIHRVPSRSTSTELRLSPKDLLVTSPSRTSTSTRPVRMNTVPDESSVIAQESSAGRPSSAVTSWSAAQRSEGNAGPARNCRPRDSRVCP